MKKIQTFLFTIVLISIAFVLFLPGLTISQTHHSDQVSRVLILLSYHDTHSWTAGILGGIKDELATADMNLELHVEFMDTKRHNPDDMFPQLEELYTTKYKDIQFDLIILSDNNALNFLLPRRNVLFPDVPVVFCGINNFSPSLLKGFDHITGVAEAFDFAGTIELALKLQPETRHVAIVCDHTPTGSAHIRDIHKVLPDFAGRVEFIKLFNQTEEELRGALQNLPEKSIIFMLSFYRDRNGKHFTIPEQSEIITEAASVPVYTAWDITLGFGVVGGVMTNGRSQGKNAAQLALRVLGGEPPEHIAVVNKSPNVVMLDYKVAKHFGLPLAKLSTETVFINKPTTFYSDHTRIIWITLFIFLIQILLISYLILNVQKRKRAEQRLKKQSEQLKNIVDERTAELSLTNKELSQEVDNRNKALQQERNLTRIIEKSLNEIYLFDADSYNFLFVNEGARVNTGYSQAEFLDMTPLDVKPKHDLSSFEEIIAPLQTGQKNKVIFETVHQRKDGSTYPVEVHLQKTEYRSRPIFAALIVDTTERKKMAKRYKELVEGTNDLILQLDREGNILYVNHMARLFSGSDPEELSGQNAFQFVHPDDRERTESWFQNCQDRHILRGSIEHRVVNKKTGAIHDLQWSATFQYDEQDQFVSNSGIGHDITERKKAEAAIRKSEEQWNRTFHSFTDIVTLQDTDLRIIKANHAACTTLDLPCDKIIGRHCHELFHGSNEPCKNCPLLVTRESFTPYTREMHHEKLGKTFLVSAAPVCDDQGRLEYIAHVAKDITEMKHLEDQLLQSQKMEAIGTLAGGIAHDFNNILSSIIGYAEFIQEEVPRESRVGKDITEVITAGNRAADLVRQILRFSRQETTEKQAFLPHLVVKEALKMLHATLPTTVVIQEDIDPDCEYIMADPSIIHQIVVNLCTNGLHAMAEQKGTLYVSLQRQELTAAETGERKDMSPGSFVVLTVKDSGCGMDQPTIDRIFEPYFTTREVGRGTGLGLAIVHGAVKEYKGFIEVESSVGKGTVFSVYLPTTEAPAAPAIAKKREDKGKTLPGNARILVVDDELLIAKINETRLKSRGYQVTAATDSRKALETFRSQPENFDLLITDQTMPGLTGADLARAVLEIKPSLPIIMCTGHSDIVSEKDAIGLGIKKYVFKPLHGDELLDAVREVLAGQHQ